jgi:putative protein-disulfide isomerase
MNDTRLLYVTDPLCLWCYGISDTIEKFYAGLPDYVETETINGGLFPGKSAKRCDQPFREYLATAAERVTSLTGKKFSQQFWYLLASENFFYDTEPSAKAAIAVKKLAGEQQVVPFIHALQQAFFIEGKNVMEAQVLTKIAENFGITSTDFIQFYFSDDCSSLTNKGYAEAKQLGVQGFPALIYLHENQGYSLAAGYSSLDHLNKALHWADKKHQETIASNQASCSISGCVS